MKDTVAIIKDTVQSVNVESNTNLSNSEDGTNWWMIIALIELGLIILLLVRTAKEKRKGISKDGLDEIRNAKSTEIDMTNLMNSMHDSKGLYKELSRKCHPDLFQDQDKKEKADNIFQLVTKHKRNYAKLVELKELAIKELEVKF